MPNTVSKSARRRTKSSAIRINAPSTISLDMRAWRATAAAASAPARHSAIFSVKCSATSFPAASAADRKCSAAQTCATNSIWIWRRRGSAPRPRSTFPHWARQNPEGGGEAGRNGGPAGDLYVEIRVKEHAIFEREGSHLSCEVPITFVTAALGGTVGGPTLDGEVTLRLPPEPQWA